jgi:dienelactone hydrolase
MVGGEVDRRGVRLRAGRVELDGDLAVPAGAGGVVLFAHGSGSSRHSPRNRQVAAALHRAGLATLLLDLLTAAEEELDRVTAELRFDVAMLGERLVAAVDWLAADAATAALPLGAFGASTGAGAALVAAAERPQAVAAVVSRGGRPDLAGPALARVRAPTLLVVGGLDREVLRLNQAALARLPATSRLEVVPGATHLFEEPGALDQVARLAAAWFAQHLGGQAPPA